MSIINEALKKAHGEKTSTLASTEAPPSFRGADSKKILPDLPKKKQRVNWGPVFVLLVLVLITGPIIAPIFSSPYRSTTASLLTPSTHEAIDNKALQTENRAKQFGIEEAPLLPAQAALITGSRPIAPGNADHPDFLMNGIVYGTPDSYCIINGKVVKVGEKIDGAVLVSVTPDKATLDYRGTPIELWVKS